MKTLDVRGTAEGEDAYLLQGSSLERTCALGGLEGFRNGWAP